MDSGQDPLTSEWCAKSLHQTCGGGIVRGGGRCQCSCHQPKARTTIEAAKVICDSIKTAEIIFRDENGTVILTMDAGSVKPGDTVSCKVPEPQDITITLI